MTVWSSMHWNDFVVLSTSLSECRCFGNKSQRVTDMVQNILKPWGNSSGCKCTQFFVVSLTSRFWWVLQRSNLQNSSTKAVSESLSKHRNKTAVQKKMNTFLSTPSCPGGVVQQKPLELLHVWEHQSREEWIWLRAVVSSAFMQTFLQHQASWGRHTFALNQEITSASKAWEHPGQIMLLSPPETWSQPTETLVTRWQTWCFLRHLCKLCHHISWTLPKNRCK